MFKKVLIANRGEIACRIALTLKRMGIRVVAVYSEADEGALHVKMADEVYLIGPAPARESYLNIPSILQIAKQCGADAIHPGYGFLSENPNFAQAVIDEGLVFIGPSPKAIQVMGDKLSAKKIAQHAGIPYLSGMEEPLEDLAQAQKIVSKMGFPLMLKAVAGGGGKGMRIVNDPSEVEGALRGAMHEALLSFGDGRIFVEKYINAARHIEIQIVADHYGNIIHLGERECSLQRRHQKVIEETPSPFISPALRQQMGENAVRLAKAVNYTSVGTVEFVMSPKGEFYFLEMNTRLQVEHPITEMVTGIDLVEEMVRIAAGGALRYQQEEIHFSGHAIEARLYAEDSPRGFLPSTGRLFSYLLPPQKEEEIRLESGVQEGDSITPYYDPLIAKLIVHQPNRFLACDSLLAALNNFYVRGVETNISFLSSLVNASFFQKGSFNTTTLDSLYADGFTPPTPENPLIAIGATAVMHCIRYHLNSADLTVLVERDPYPVVVTVENRQATIQIGNKTLVIKTQWEPGGALFKGVFDDQAITLQIDSNGIKNTLSWNGYCSHTCIVNARTAELMAYMPMSYKPDTSLHIVAPMPGLIVGVAVHEGDSIKKGQPILIIEAMKMENIIRTICDGIVEKIYVQKGDHIILDQLLVQMK